MYAASVNANRKTLSLSGIAALKIILFSLYNITYVLFIRGHMKQSVNLILMICFVGLNAADYFFRTNWTIRKSSLFTREFMLVFTASLVITVISLFIEIRNHNVQSYFFTGVLHIILPALCVFFWINTTNETLFDIYFYIFVFRFIFQILIIGSGSFSFENIRSISWFDSKSSVFESSGAHDLLFLTFYFKYKKKNISAFICTILCMISLKRLSFILAPLCLFFFDKISDKPVPKWLLTATKLFFIISPFLYLLLLNDSVDAFFVTRFGIGINKFTTGRIQLVRIFAENRDLLNGFDSSTAYLMKNGYASTNMHCDVVKIFLETTILSLIVLVNNFFEIVKKDTRLYLLMLYAFAVMTTSHFLDYISGWIILHMIVAVVLYEKNKERVSRGNSGMTEPLFIV